MPTLSRDEAQGALNDITATQRRSFEAFGYSAAAPFLMLWGVLWMAGYGTTEFAPYYAGDAWLAIVIIGVIASTLLGMRLEKRPRHKFNWRIACTWLATMGFLVSLFSIIGPISGAQVGAIIPLMIAWAYAVMGFWMGARFIAAGILIAALTLGGYFYLPEHFAGWMAIVGGSTLFLTGLWLRSA